MHYTIVENLLNNGLLISKLIPMIASSPLCLRLLCSVWVCTHKHILDIRRQYHQSFVPELATRCSPLPLIIFVSAEFFPECYFSGDQGIRSRNLDVKVGCSNPSTAGQLLHFASICWPWHPSWEMVHITISLLKEANDQRLKKYWTVALGVQVIVNWFIMQCWRYIHYNYLTLKSDTGRIIYTE